MLIPGLLIEPVKQGRKKGTKDTAYQGSYSSLQITYLAQNSEVKITLKMEYIKKLTTVQRYCEQQLSN